MLERIKKILSNSETENTGFRKKHNVLTKQILVSVTFGLTVGFLAQNLNHQPSLNNKQPIESQIDSRFQSSFGVQNNGIVRVQSAQEYDQKWISQLKFREQDSLYIKNLSQNIKELHTINQEYFKITSQLAVDLKKNPTITIQDYEVFSLISNARIRLLTDTEPATDAQTSLLLKQEISSMKNRQTSVDVLYGDSLAKSDKDNANMRGEYTSGPSFSKN